VDDKIPDGMDAGLTGWADPVARLRQAIEKDEFALYCQPILGLAAGGYPLGEILVRMQEEESAMLPPGDFLPVLKHYGMLSQFDRWVVRNALQALAAGSRIPRLTVNVSEQTLTDGDFLGYVAAQLATQKIAPEQLLFEIDENDVLGLCRRLPQGRRRRADRRLWPARGFVRRDQGHRRRLHQGRRHRHAQDPRQRDRSQQDGGDRASEPITALRRDRGVCGG
jgi:hypothetical protein